MCSPLKTVLICLFDAQPVDAVSRSCPASLTLPSALSAHLGTVAPGLPSLILKRRRREKDVSQLFKKSFYTHFGKNA